jgi:hypothetical protein
MESIHAMLPVGFRFRPSDEELITNYLLNKVKGQPLNWDDIRESYMYGEKLPWQICGDLCDQEENLYFFTRLKKLSKNQVARTTGYGVWHENFSDNVYDNQGNIIGAKKTVLFQGERRLVHEEIRLDYARVLTRWGNQLSSVHRS